MRYRGFFHTYFTLKRNFRGGFGNLYYVLAGLKGIKFDGRPLIIGAPRFRLYPGSSMIIGKNAELLSGHSDNQIGIDRPCMFSTVTPVAKVVIGNNCGFSGTVIGAHQSITLGDDVKCGANTLITDSDWHPEDPRSGGSKAVKIGDNVWLGVNSVVLKGSTIGENTVIGANSVVSGTIPSNVIAAGNPCKVIREI